MNHEYGQYRCFCGVPNCGHPPIDLRSLPLSMIPLTQDQAIALILSRHWTPPAYDIPPSPLSRRIRLPPSTGPLSPRIAVRQSEITSYLRSGAPYYTGEYRTDFDPGVYSRDRAASFSTPTPTGSPRRPAAPVASSSNETQKTCSICQDDFPASQCARLLPCHHDDFCVQCVKAMLASNAATSRSCPLCRNPFEAYHTKDGVVNVEQLDFVGEFQSIDGSVYPRYIPPDPTFGIHWR
ncbi:hypothetical protein BDD12DRAFT_896447 [Trichophaea hybrida]|nr:hypothetical protein BDD12DRAFT_896447 [Trichophaea hybrida]